MFLVERRLPLLFILTPLCIRSLASQCRLRSQTDPGATKLRELEKTIKTVECDVVNYINFPDYSPQSNEVFDFIVVGAGSAGSVMASRLSENPHWRVLLLEAGGDPDIASEFPSLTSSLWRSSLDWNYTTQPDARSCLGSENQRCFWPRGKVLGGSSTINSMFYVRGHPEVFDSWERGGNRGWGYKDLLHYFKKSEDIESDEVKENKYFRFYHGEDGNLTVESFHQDCGLNILTQNLSKAYNELGYKTFKDLNAYFGDGLLYVQGTLRDGRRCSTAKAFIKPALLRNNLKISKLSTVKKILFNKNQAYGVTFEKFGIDFTVKVRKEVIISAGAINSPQLLMLSGIGPKSHLDDIGIPVISDLNVGGNLQDHYIVRGVFASFNGGLLKPNDNEGIIKSVFQSIANSGINVLFNSVSYLTTQHANYPNIMYFFSAYAANSTETIIKENKAFRLNKVYLQSLAKLNNSQCIINFRPSIVSPKSRGRILLKSINPREHPLIYPNYLLAEDDLKALLAGIEFVQEILNTNAMKKLGARLERLDIPSCKFFKFETVDYWNCLIRYSGTTLFHPAGTCRMGPRGLPDSVVDPNLEVIGVTGLRVVDASVMPTIPNGNLNAPTIAIAERASDIIKLCWKSRSGL